AVREGLDVDGDVGQVEDGGAHVNGGLRESAALHGVLDAQRAAAGLDGHGAGGDAEAVVGELRDAADAITAHLALGAVGVEHAHADIGARRRGAANEYHTVGADAGVAVAHGAGQFGPVGAALDGGV